VSYHDRLDGLDDPVVAAVSAAIEARLERNYGNRATIDAAAVRGELAADIDRRTAAEALALIAANDERLDFEMTAGSMDSKRRVWVVGDE